MRKIILTALAAAGLLSPAMFVSRAQAVTIPVPAAAIDTGLVQKAAVICGYRGCVRTYPRYRYGYGYPYRYGWRRRYW